jgi:hypothetical protein
MVIKKEGSKDVVRSNTGKSLGKYKTKKAAKKRLGQVEYFKRKK